MSKRKYDKGLVPEKLQFLADLSRTSSWIASRYAVFLKPYNISGPQFNVLRVLRTANDWVAMNEINPLLIVKSPNITRLVDKLVAKALVNRDRSTEDRRVVYVQITSEGQKLLAQMDKEHSGEMSDFMDSFTKKEAIMMSEILRKIRE